jgi:alpha-L-rhamnosidase
VLKSRLVLLLALSFLQSAAQDLVAKEWKASWIATPGSSPDGYGVYLFRRLIDLPTLPSSLPVCVSADNRYKLYVNDSLVSIGPARGDVHHWNYATVDLAPFLHKGTNCVAAQVWNEGPERTEAQISFRTGFILQAAGPEGRALNTDTGWLTVMDSSYSPLKVRVPGYYVAGPGQLTDMNKKLTGWTTGGYPATGWKHAQVIAEGVPRNIPTSFASTTAWLLTPSSLPPMQLAKQRISTIRKSEGITVSPDWPNHPTPLAIPPNSQATILFDQSSLTNAYPTLVFSGGKNARLSLTYAEALYSPSHGKGNRSDIDGKSIIGRRDSILSDGSDGQSFTTLTWRTWRYIRLRITTGDEPLVLNDIYGTFVGYPFEQKAQFRAASPELDSILAIGWHTARLCAIETYMDCPYYEQLQYVGDTRIQALVSLYNSGDDRLVKNAIEQIDLSRRPEGVTLSRYPTQMPQLIPPFSLWWIGMLHDYWRYGSDTAFAAGKLPGTRQVLSFFHGFQQPDGSLHGLPYWTFTDWVNSPGWNTGMAPIGADGSSSVLDLQLLWSYQLAAEMENRSGIKEYAGLYRSYASRLKTTIRAKYWDSKRRLFADRPEKDLFSQHANTLAILTGVADQQEAKSIAKHLLTDTSLAQASIYFRYYLHLALTRAGYGNDYLQWLNKWRENITLGLTTWAEMSDVADSRSDCHAWGASPNIEFFRTILGLDSEAPGFTRVRVEPHLGSLKNAAGSIPHPNGTLSASYRQNNDKWDIRLELPPGTSGRLIWKQKEYPLKSGLNTFKSL